MNRTSFDPPEPPEPAYCELCDEYDDDCTCEVGYQEERDDD